MRLIIILIILISYTNIKLISKELSINKKIVVLFKRDINKFIQKNETLNERKEIFQKYYKESLLKKYINNNSYEVAWTDWMHQYDKSFPSFNLVSIDKITKKPLLYFRKTNILINYKTFIPSFKNFFLEQLFTLLNYNNLVGFISNTLCHCGINESNIRKSIYNNKIVYFAQKKFTRIEDGFKVKHDFKIKISKYGEIVDLNWIRLGERIERPKIKSKKKKK